MNQEIGFTIQIKSSTDSSNTLFISYDSATKKARVRFNDEIKEFETLYDAYKFASEHILPSMTYNDSTMMQFKEDLSWIMNNRKTGNSRR